MDVHFPSFSRSCPKLHKDDNNKKLVFVEKKRLKADIIVLEDKKKRS